MSELRIPPPDPEPPDCPLCGQHTEIDADGDLLCFACRIMWPRAGNWWGDGVPVPDDEQIPRCGATVAPHPDFEARYLCVRRAGHKAKHAGVREDNPEWTWSWAMTEDEAKVSHG